MSQSRVRIHNLPVWFLACVAACISGTDSSAQESKSLRTGNRPELDHLSIQNEIRGQIKTERFVVERGETITALGDIEVTASGEIRIDGNLFGSRVLQANGSIRGASIKLRSLTRIVIAGNLWAGDGSDSEADGVKGGVAGALILETPVVKCNNKWLVGARGGNGGGNAAEGGSDGDVVVRGFLVGSGIQGGNGGSGGPGVDRVTLPGGEGGTGGRGGNALIETYPIESPSEGADAAPRDPGTPGQDETAGNNATGNAAGVGPNGSPCSAG